MRFSIHVDCPPGRPTGIGRYMLELTRALGAEGDPVECWTRWRWLKEARALFSSSAASIHPLLSTGRWNDMILPGLYSRFRGIDLVHSPNGNLLPKTGAFRQTLMIHDLAFILFPDSKPPEETLMWKQKVERAVQLADGILVNSKCTRNDLLESFPEARGKTHLTRLGIDHLPFEKRTSGGRHLLSVGTVEPRKNITGLIKAYEEAMTMKNDLPPLVIAGGMGYRSDEILEAAKTSPAGKRITFTGYVSERQLLSLYEDALCLVHPALYEGFGFTVPEALGFGIPVVCSDNSALGELFGNAVYRVDPLDHSSIARGIMEALEKGVTEGKTAAVEKLFSELTWKNCAQATLNAFRGIS